MEIILIAAIAKNRIIGRDNKLPWNIPEDLRLFKQATMGYPMIMGRKTFESLARPLPGRRHIVLSRNSTYRPSGGEYAATLSDALAMCGDVEKVFVIGGSQIFQQALPIATCMILTMLDREADGDVLFPEFAHEGFVETERKEYPACSEPFTVVTYRRLQTEREAMRPEGIETSSSSSLGPP
jgi:dihydrofolate reductase